MDVIGEIVTKEKLNGKTVGLITGCFDIVHIGHLNLFRFAKKHVGVVVVGLDSDASIKLSKSPNRPLFPINKRLDFMSSIIEVDYVFPISYDFDFNNTTAPTILFKITKKVSPTHLITNTEADTYWKEKKIRAQKLGIIFLPYKQIPHSSSKIINHLESEF